MGVLKLGTITLLVAALSSTSLVAAATTEAPTAPAQTEATSTPGPTPEPSDEPGPEPTPTPGPTAEPDPVDTDEPTREPEADEAPDVDQTVATSADRLEGIDRYATAVAVSQEAFASGADIVFLASGADYPDALSAAPLAAMQGGPLLLTDAATLPNSVVAELTRLAPTDIILVGGPAIISSAVEAQLRTLGATVQRVFGTDRYATSRALITAFADPSTSVYIATGENYPDALAAAAAAGASAMPVLLVNGSASTLDAPSLALLSARGTQTAYIAGGPGAVSHGVEQRLTTAVSTVLRLAGADRYATAVAINAHAFATADRAFVATGAGYADALSGAVLAAIENAPLFLSGPTCLPRATHSAMINTMQVNRVTLLGGTGVLSARVAQLDPCSTVDDDRATSIAELVAALNLRLRSLPGVYSVSVRELGGLDTVVSINGSEMQEPASVMKLFVVYAVLDRIDKGQLSFSTTTRSGLSVRECMRVTIHVSDNLCHWDLVALIGNQALNNQFWAEGYTRTVYQGYSGNGSYYSSKYTSTNDVALLLTRLRNGELLSAASTAHFMELLETQVWRHRLPAGMPPGTPLANKTGHLWVASGYIHADVAIVTAPAGQFVVAVIGSQNATAAGVRDIGTTVYSHFNGPVSTFASYSALNLITTSTVPYYSNAGSGQLGVIPAGARVEAYASARDWYRVRYSSSYVYIHSSALRNYFDYPRS